LFEFFLDDRSCVVNLLQALKKEQSCPKKQLQDGSISFGNGKIFYNLLHFFLNLFQKLKKISTNKSTQLKQYVIGDKIY